MKEFILLNQTFETDSINEKEMAELAKQIGQIIQFDDTLLLSGEIGAGKSYFAENSFSPGNFILKKCHPQRLPWFRHMRQIQVKFGMWTYTALQAPKL